MYLFCRIKIQYISLSFVYISDKVFRDIRKLFLIKYNFEIYVIRLFNSKIENGTTTRTYG